MTMLALVVVLLAWAAATTSAEVRVVRIIQRGQDSGWSFQPAIVNAALGDVVRFTWPAQNGSKISVVASNTSAVCQPLSSSSPGFFACAASSTPGSTCDVTVAAPSFAAGQTYSFRGSDSNNASACPAAPTTNAVFAGQLLVGTVPLDCSGATSRSACLAQPHAPTDAACVWCGFGSPGSGGLDEGFCYAPLWSGSMSCPCADYSCWADYGCPAAASSVYCGSSCTRDGQPCPPYHQPDSNPVSGYPWTVRRYYVNKCVNISMQVFDRSDLLPCQLTPPTPCELVLGTTYGSSSCEQYPNMFGHQIGTNYRALGLASCTADGRPQGPGLALTTVSTISALASLGCLNVSRNGTTASISMSCDSAKQNLITTVYKNSDSCVGFGLKSGSLPLGCHAQFSEAYVLNAADVCPWVGVAALPKPEHKLSVQARQAWDWAMQAHPLQPFVKFMN